MKTTSIHQQNLPPQMKIQAAKKPFSWKERAAGFCYAFQGIRALFRTEHNAWIHTSLTLIVVFLSFFLHVNKTEWLFLLLVMTLVWTMETINTALEKAMDFISLEEHPQIKLVKDLAAGAVLISALAAFLIGAIIFLPKLMHYV